MMLRSIFHILVTFLALATSTAQASPMTPDPTGMWYDPAQPGWGMSITQQGGAIFVALFVYDANHNPQWFVASDVTDSGTFVNMLVGEAYTGTLYKTTGPFYATPSDMTAFAATPVGTIQLAYVQPIDNLSVTYTVNGTSVTKVVQPQTWGSNASQLVGTFTGAININSIASCQAPQSLQGVTRFTISQGTTPDSLTMNWGSGVDIGCSVNGTYAQRGQFGTLTGPVLCGPIPNVITNVGTFTISQITSSPSGFSGSLSYSMSTAPGSNCAVGGSIGGVKNP